MTDILKYQGKRCVVTGAASGMGGACAQILVDLGAEVHALDIQPIEAPVKQAIKVDLSSEESIDSALSQIDGEIDHHFNCAGLPGAPRFSSLDTMLVNFVGLRHITESLLPRIKDGGSIASITSVAGMGYPKNQENVHALLGITDFSEARKWCEERPEVANGYLFSKQCIIGYTYSRAAELAQRRVRINCLSPAPTDTPMMPAFHEQIPKEAMDEHFQAPIGRNATPEEMAEPLIALNSAAMSFVSGVNLFVDYGYTGQVFCGQRAGLL
jgi:NAD(P)-dependent dehydrogenase (short-subunit alcohol dehydrogenase family)